MRYQVKEKTIYSESDLLHFGEVQVFGDIVNTLFPDYTGISVGSTIYQSTNKAEVEKLKKHLEILRIRSLNEMIIAFFDDDEIANKFYASNNFINLQTLYINEFNLKLIKRFHMEVVNKGFYIPKEANNKHIFNIQKLLNLYFYYIEEVSDKEVLNISNIDWVKRLSILYQDNGLINNTENKFSNVELRTQTSVNAKSENKRVIHKEANTTTKLVNGKQKPWWKFW